MNTSFDGVSPATCAKPASSLLMPRRHRAVRGRSWSASSGTRPRSRTLILPALPTEKPRANRLAPSSTSSARGLGLGHASAARTRRAKKSRPPKLPRFQRQQQRRPGAFRTASTARRDRSPRRCASRLTPSAPTTAPLVSPPATTRRRTPRATRPRGDVGHRVLDQRARRLAAELGLQRRHLVRRRGRGDHAPASSPSLSVRPVERLPRQRVRVGRRERIELERRHPVARGRRPGTASRASTSRPAPPHGPARRGSAPASASAQQPGAAEVLRQPHRHAGAAGDQRVAGDRLADREQMRVGDRVDDRVAPALLLQRRRARRGSRRRRCSTVANGTSPTVAVGLPRQHAHQVRVAHRRQRMVLHAALVQQRGADEQVALVDGARIGGEGRAGDARSRSRARRPARRRPGRYCRRRCCRRWSSI